MLCFPYHFIRDCQNVWQGNWHRLSTAYKIILLSCIVAQDGQQSSSAELQCAALLTALYKQFPSFVMSDGPNFPCAKPFLQHI